MGPSLNYPAWKASRQALFAVAAVAAGLAVAWAVIWWRERKREET